jgi:hypothetical protein
MTRKKIKLYKEIRKDKNGNELPLGIVPLESGKKRERRVAPKLVILREKSPLLS